LEGHQYRTHLVFRARSLLIVGDKVQVYPGGRSIRGAHWNHRELSTGIIVISRILTIRAIFALLEVTASRSDRSYRRHKSPGLSMLLSTCSFRTERRGFTLRLSPVRVTPEDANRARQVSFRIDVTDGVEKLRVNWSVPSPFARLGLWSSRPAPFGLWILFLASMNVKGRCSSVAELHHEDRTFFRSPDDEPWRSSRVQSAPNETQGCRTRLNWNSHYGPRSNWERLRCWPKAFSRP